MNCNEIQALFEMYHDLPEDDVRRCKVRKHIEHCCQCKEEFEMWDESAELMRIAGMDDDVPPLAQPMASKVMNRIYEAESWRMPVPQRVYLISHKMWRNFTAVIAAC